MSRSHRLIRFGLFCGFLVLSAGLGLSAQGSGKRIALVAPDNVATIVYAEGVVKVNGKVVDIGAQVPDGATLVTAPDALAEVVFNQKNIIRIGGGSIVTLDLSKLLKVVSIDQGGVAAVLHRLDKLNGGGLEVRTKTTVAAVRGTSFFTEVDPTKPDASYVCICNGNLHLSDASGGNDASVSSSHHKAELRAKTADGYSVTAATLIGHDDKSMDALAARIGETIDWNKTEE